MRWVTCLALKMTGKLCQWRRFIGGKIDEISLWSRKVDLINKKLPWFIVEKSLLLPYLVLRYFFVCHFLIIRTLSIPEIFLPLNRHA